VNAEADAMTAFDVLSLGEALVDFIPSRRGRLRDVSAFERHPGGAPANVAIGCARLGARTAFLGAVGDDEFGRFLGAALAQEGVDVSRLRYAKGHQTGLSFIALDERGERSFRGYGHPRADLALAPEDVDQAWVASARIVHFGTNTLRTGPARAATYRAADAARRAGRLVSCDPNLRLHVWGHADELRAALAESLPRAHIVKLSADETEFALGETDPHRAARILVERGALLGLVTLAERGCAWARARDGGTVPAPRVEVVDTTGAGDGFVAGLLAGLSREGAAPDAMARDPLERVLRLACEVGSRVCTRMGAVAGLPRRDEIAS
jgi:fructokinase